MTNKEIPFDERIASGFIKAPIGAGGGITEFLGFEITDASPGVMVGQFEVREDLHLWPRSSQS